MNQRMASISEKVEDKDIDESKIEDRELYTFPDGTTYEGQWVGKSMHGKGCHIKDDVKYTGEF